MLRLYVHWLSCAFLTECPKSTSKWFWWCDAINITVRKDSVYGFELPQIQRYIPVTRCKGKNGVYWLGPIRKCYFWLLEQWWPVSNHIQLCGTDASDEQIIITSTCVWRLQVLSVSTNLHDCTVLFNPLKPELNPICYLRALLGAHHFLHVSRIRVKLLIFRLLMSYIHGAPILDVSRSHTTTQHSR